MPHSNDTRFMSSPPDSDDDQAAFDAFTKSVPRETVADRSERSEAGANRVKQAFWGIQIYSLCSGVGAAAATLIWRPMPLLSSTYAAVGAILGAVVGSVAFILFVLVSYLRHGGWRSEERVNVVPTIWLYGPLGAIGGSTLIVMAVNNKLANAQVFSALPTLVGAILGFLVCAVIRLIKRPAAGRDGPAGERRYFWP
jgi:hypothetical protein